MTAREDLTAWFVAHPTPLCDDCLASATQVTPRQRARDVALGLESLGVVLRGEGACSRCSKDKIVTWRDRDMPAPPPAEPPESSIEDRPWFWEGNVQHHLAHWLKATGHEIVSTADTARRDRGVDIVATKEAQETWVTVKGWPRATARTQPYLQARHYFAGAMLDVLVYRSENPAVAIAVGLPDGFPTYATLASRVKSLAAPLRFDFLWVDSSGRVRRG